MKAIVWTKYGPPDDLQLKEVAKSTPKDNEVPIRIYATSVTAAECVFRKGSWFINRLFFTGLRKPKITMLGAELAGEIESVDKDVKLLKKGDNEYIQS